MFKDLTDLFKQYKQGLNHLHHEFAYRYFDDVKQVFINKGSHGIGIQLSILGGADDEKIESLNRIMSDLPTGDKSSLQTYGPLVNYYQDQLDHRMNIPHQSLCHSA